MERLGGAATQGTTSHLTGRGACSRTRGGTFSEATASLFMITTMIHWYLHGSWSGALRLEGIPMWRSRWTFILEVQLSEGYFGYFVGWLYIEFRSFIARFPHQNLSTNWNLISPTSLYIFSLPQPPLKKHWSFKMKTTSPSFPLYFVDKVFLKVWILLFLGFFPHKFHSKKISKSPKFKGFL